MKISLLATAALAALSIGAGAAQAQTATDGAIEQALIVVPYYAPYYYRPYSYYQPSCYWGYYGRVCSY